MSGWDTALEKPESQPQQDAIPEDLRETYARLKDFRNGGPAYILGSMDSVKLIERLVVAETALTQAREALRHAASALAATGCKTKGAKEAYRKVAAALAATQEDTDGKR